MSHASDAARGNATRVSEGMAGRRRRGGEGARHCVRRQLGGLHHPGLSLLLLLLLLLLLRHSWGWRYSWDVSADVGAGGATGGLGGRDTGAVLGGVEAAGARDNPPGVGRAESCKSGLFGARMASWVVVVVRS